jgi:competence protein ComEC
MPKFGVTIWKSVPLLRLLLALITGILLQYHFKINLHLILVVFCLSVIAFVAYLLLKISQKFLFSWVGGVSIMLLFISVGGFLSYNKNIKHNKEWLGNYYNKNHPVLLTMQEPLIEKSKSYKALAKADAILINNEWVKVKGYVLIYFKKDSSKPDLQYGSQIIVAKPLQPIINSGNPGGFNYAEYCLFQNISYQTFLSSKDYQTLTTTNKNFFDDGLMKARTSVLSTLRENIKTPDELSIAEALLIGYRDDLDRDLVQSYSNTGVVHIIAISGLHLGMMYGLLVLLFGSFKKYRLTKFIKPIAILVVLWGFTFLAGAVPSILRSAVMFTFIVIGESIGRKTNIYNTLATSAFTILLFNPFSLWDVGFQLSYAAVLSIVLFQKYIQHWLYFNNKLIKGIWSLCSVTISAQILTLPIVLYHFHQFPNLFLFTNLFAVPFSGFILYGELLLLLVSKISFLATFVGSITGWMIGVMNHFIERVNNLPFSVWEYIQINTMQTIILYISIAGFAWWLIQKQNKGLLIGLSCFALFIAIRSFDFIQKETQQKLIVYNVPQHTAIDIINGRNYQFIGDSILLEDGFLRNFHLKPSRVLHRISDVNSLNISFQNNVINSTDKSIAIIDKPLIKTNLTNKIKVNAIIITKNPKLYINQLNNIFDCNKIIFDASNPLWKIEKWKKDCDSLHLRHYSIPEQGAFVMEL